MLLMTDLFCSHNGQAEEAGDSKLSRQLEQLKIIQGHWMD
jgi:hypothetical protein